MFDTHHHGPRSIHQTTTVTEKRAPTDESVRLLKEMEQAAQDKLLSITRLKDNSLDATWHIFEDPARDNMEAICRFSLNGQEHRIKIPIERSMRYKEDEIGAKIHEAITREIAAVLAVDLFRNEGSTLQSYIRPRSLR